MSETEIVERLPIGLWIRVAIFTAIMTIAMTFLMQFTGIPYSSGSLNYTASYGGYTIMALPWIVSFIMIFFIDYGKVKVEKRTMAVFYFALLVLSAYMSHMTTFSIPSAFVRVRTTQVHSYALPLMWFPSEEAVRGAFYSGSLNNLFVTYANEWMMSILTFTAWYLIGLSMTMGLVLILRRLWIDVESFPFPHAQGWMTAELALVGRTTDPVTSKRKKVFIICTIIGFLLLSPYVVWTAYPAFPDPYGWYTSPHYFSFALGLQRTTNAYPSLKAIIAAPLLISYNPALYAVWFLAPLATIYSNALGCAIVFILPQILSYFGYYEGIYAVDDIGKRNIIFGQPPLSLRNVASGMLAGITIFLLVFRWRYFLNSLRSAFAKKDKGGEQYLLGWVMFIVGAVALAALMYASGVEFRDSFVLVFIVLLYTVAVANMRSFSGLWKLENCSETYWRVFWGPPNMPAAPDMPAGKLFALAHTNRISVGADNLPFYAPTLAFLDSYKIASINKFSVKLMLKILLLCSVINIVILFPTLYFTWHQFGFMETLAAKEWDFFWVGDAGEYNNTMTQSWPNLHWFTGFILVGVLMFLRSRYFWWPIEPIGLLVSFDESLHIGAIGGSLAPSLVGGLVKYIVIKFGGRKVYEEVGLPGAFGIITGTVFSILVCAIIVGLRFLAGLT